MLQLLRDNANTTEVVKDWFMSQMIGSFKDQSVPQDFKDYMKAQGVSDDHIVMILEANPRILFDVFDNNELIINVIHTGNGFIWDVADVKSVKLYSSRKQAEIDAVTRAYEMLNDKLNVTLNEGSDSTTSVE